MNQRSSRTTRRTVAAALAAVPFGFGVVRAIQTGKDFRYLLTAVASFAAAVMILRLGASRRPGAVPIRLAVLALGGSTVAAGVVARLLGALNGPAILIVALGFSLCTTAGVTLWLRAGAE